MKDWEEFERKIWKEFIENGISAILTSKKGGLYGDVETPDLLVECTYKKNSGVLRLGRERIDRTIRNGEIRKKIPIVVIGLKGTNEKFVFMRFDDFMSLYKTYEACKSFEESFTYIKFMLEEKYRILKLNSSNQRSFPT